MSDSIPSAKNSDVSRTPQGSRRNPLKLALQHVSRGPVAPGLLGLLVCGAAPATPPTWDCRMAADGRSWQCLKDGQLHADPPAPAPDGVAVTPATTPADRVGVPLPAPAPPPDPAATPVTPAPARTPAVPAPRGPTAAPVPPPAPIAPTPAPPPATRPAPAAAAAATLPEPPSPPSPPVAPAAVDTPAARAFDRAADVPDLTAPVGPAAAPPAAPSDTAAATPGADSTVATPGPDAAPAPRAPTPSAASAALTSAIDQGIDWRSCGVAATDGRAPTRRRPAGRRGIPVEISADTAVAELDPERAVFSGNVELVQDDVRLYAQRVTLDRVAGTADAEGGLLLTQPDIRFAGDSASYRLASGEAEIDRASYRVPAIRARGDAERAAFLGNGISRFDTISYTTCAPGDNTWLLTADALELDQNQGFGTARHASLRFFGVPLLYAPRLTFPIDDRRRSGVLVPTVGYSGNTGVDISVPYYFNLAPNYDLTLTPRLMSERGLLLGGEFRFLTETTRGTLAADVLPDDRERDSGSSTRGSASLYTRSTFNPRTTAALRLNYASDSDYFRDLGGDLAATSATHLERTGELLYHGDSWDLLGQVQYYQTIDDTIAASDRPYSQLPLLRFALEQPGGLFGTTYHVGAEYAYFHRDDSVRGHRVDLTPALSLPVGDDWWYVEPKAGARYTAYRLTDQAAGRDDAPSHLTGLLSLDSGLLFDRTIGYLGGSATQTLEPRLYYLYVPASAQNDQPLFDTAAFDFRFDNLFRDNRFNGPDRVGDANQVTLALTSRVNDGGSGEELLRASIGQIYHFADREVTLPGEPEDDESSSAVIGELAARLGRGWRTRAGLQWDPHDGDDGTIDQALAQLSYRSERRQVFNAAYRLRDGVARQTDVAFFWPINEQFTLIGRHNYSLRDSRLLEALAGFEYGKCCWRLRLVARKYVDGDGDQHNLAFLLQLELRGLGRLGDDIDRTLERGIYGYRLNDDD